MGSWRDHVHHFQCLKQQPIWAHWPSTWHLLHAFSIFGDLGSVHAVFDMLVIDPNSDGKKRFERSQSIMYIHPSFLGPTFDCTRQGSIFEFWFRYLLLLLCWRAVNSTTWSLMIKVQQSERFKKKLILSHCTYTSWLKAGQSYGLAMVCS